MEFFYQEIFTADKQLIPSSYFAVYSVLTIDKTLNQTKYI